MSDIKVTPCPSFDEVKPTLDPSPTEEIPPVFDVQDDERAVYDGDISDSILRKLSAYYTDYGNNSDYVILREGQYSYVLVFGTVDGTLYDGTIVRYNSSSYSYDATVSVSQGTYRADMTGDTGYIYSSNPSFLPSPYIDRTNIQFRNFGSVVVLSFFIALLVFLVDYIFCIRRRRR